MLNYRKEIEGVKKWLAKPINRKLLCDDPSYQISAAIAEKSAYYPGVIANGLQSLATWHEMQGVAKIADADVLGWASLHLAARYNFWAIKIFIQQWEIGGRKIRSLPSTVKDCTLSLLDTIAYGDDSEWMAIWYENELFQGYYKKNTHSIERGIPGYAVALAHACATNVQPLTGKLPLSVYSNVVAGWNDPAKLAAAIVAMCDYRLTRMEDTDEDIGEFCDIPYKIVPVEYLALGQVRKLQGLDLPRVDHHLLQTPFAKPPELISPVSDPLLDRSLAAVRESLSGL
jgi:hypothetical protein